MKTPISARIEMHLEQHRLSTDALAARLLERAPSLEPTVILAQLSRLLAEGSAQVLEEAEFTAALGAELGVTFEHLQFLNRIPVLLLHPSLPESAQGYLRARALECYHTCDWIVACARGPESEPRLVPVATVKAMRDLAGNIHRPVLVPDG